MKDKNQLAATDQDPEFTKYMNTPLLTKEQFEHLDGTDAIRKYIHDVYSRKATTQDQRRQIASKLNLTQEQLATPETRAKIADYLAKTQDNKYYHYVSKQELFWEMKKTMADDDADAAERSRADALCDKLIVDIERLEKEIWGEFSKEGREAVIKRGPENRIKKGAN